MLLAMWMLFAAWLAIAAAQTNISTPKVDVFPLDITQTELTWPVGTTAAAMSFWINPIGSNGGTIIQWNSQRSRLSLQDDHTVLIQLACLDSSIVTLKSSKQLPASMWTFVTAMWIEQPANRMTSLQIFFGGIAASEVLAIGKSMSWEPIDNSLLILNDPTSVANPSNAVLTDATSDHYPEVALMVMSGNLRLSTWGPLNQMIGFEPSLQRPAMMLLPPSYNAPDPASVAVCFNWVMSPSIESIASNLESLYNVLVRTESTDPAEYTSSLPAVFINQRGKLVVAVSLSSGETEYCTSSNAVFRPQDLMKAVAVCTYPSTLFADPRVAIYIAGELIDVFAISGRLSGAIESPQIWIGHPAGPSALHISSYSGTVFALSITVPSSNAPIDSEIEQ